MIFFAGVFFNCKSPARAQMPVIQNTQDAAATNKSRETDASGISTSVETTENWNDRLSELSSVSSESSAAKFQEYRIGADDVLDVKVVSAPEMDRQVRVASNGDVSLPLVGAVHASGLTPHELENVVETLLRHDNQLRNPQVSVFVHEIQSHPVSVVGAVQKPGVLQIGEPKSLLEILSLTGGLTDDAGDTVIIVRGPGRGEDTDSVDAQRQVPALANSSLRVADHQTPSSGALAGSPENSTADDSVPVNLKKLLDSADPRLNPLVYPGDIVKVARAGIVYVVGAVVRPGGFVMKTNEKMSVLQTIALSEGLTHTAAKGSARIIRTDPLTGARTEVRINLGNILSGKSPDPVLNAGEIVFVPESGAKKALSKGTEAATQTIAGLLIFHW